MSKNLEFIFLTVLAIVVIVVGVVFLYENNPKYRTYDCRISEISPDFPPEVREECRKKRSVK